MASNSKLVYNAQATGSLNINGATAGTYTGGPTFMVAQCVPGSLSALVTVDAETNTLTMSGVWEVSNDASTWYQTTPVNNAAHVVLATGTAGADASVTKVIPANDAVYGFRYARLSILNGVATGGSSDTYSIGYNYAKP